MNTSGLTQGHDHHLAFFDHPDGLECDACDGSHRCGVSCAKCKFTIHESCTFVFNFKETFEHPSHVGHCLKLLTTGAPDHTDPKCHICCKNTKLLLYHCSICNLNLDIDCMVDAMCAQTHLNMPWHPHPLFILDFGGYMRCEVCGLAKKSLASEYGYFCPRCRLIVHTKCFSKFKSSKITHPSHTRHPLKLLTDRAPDYTDPDCHLCGKDTGSLLYHCEICKFNLDLDCVIKTPLQVSLSNLKVHEHTVKLMPRLISFVCDACGTKGDRAPYVCLQCDFVIHQKCANLPRFIHVNHHDHRVSYTYPLGLGEWKCGVCWEEIDWSHGAYSCSTCPNYAIHSRCATRKDVWDGIELDGIPEEVEDIEPFKINDDNTITHFAHEHNLSLNKEDITLKESIFCGACVRPIGSRTFYNCVDCSFILHETCANLPRKKRHFLSPRPLTLCSSASRFEEICSACLQVCCNGFMYHIDPFRGFDLLCTSITVPFFHGSHPHHPLLYLIPSRTSHMRTCQSCNMDEEGPVLGCIKCSYFLDFRCATLPLTVRLPRYDDHPLTLCYGEKASGKYWCDVCERETNPKTWFYTCEDSMVTLHVLCVLGDIRYAKPGGKITQLGEDVELLPNNTSSRPLCYKCYCRCPGPFILKDYNGAFEVVFCSYYCFRRSRPSMYSRDQVKCPPWALETQYLMRL